MSTHGVRLLVALGVLILVGSVVSSSTASSDTSKSVTQQSEKLGNGKNTNQRFSVYAMHLETSAGKSTVGLFTDDIVLDEGNLVRTIDCRGRNVVVNGGNNKLTLRGECNTLTVTGAGNKITVEEVGAIVTEGNDNEVTWTRGLGGKNPKISNPGKHNIIKQATKR